MDRRRSPSRGARPSRRGSRPAVCTPGGGGGYRRRHGLGRRVGRIDPLLVVGEDFVERALQRAAVDRVGQQEPAQPPQPPDILARYGRAAIGDIGGGRVEQIGEIAELVADLRDDAILLRARKSGVAGKSVSVGLELGGWSIIQKKKTN